MSINDSIHNILGFAPLSTGEANKQATHSGRISRRANYRANSLAGIEITEEYRKVIRILDEGFQLTHVTGKAGTGKTTLIDFLRQHISGNCVVLAPTGVAALQVRGTTIHSFFRFPPSVLSRKDVKATPRRRLYKKLDVLIIDEISMVRADVIDAMDAFLRLNGRDKSRPFGGVQVVMVGDLYQLPPVVSTEEEAIFFSRKYESPFFFSAKALEEHVIAPVELTRVFRQQDPDFVEMLNRIRLGDASEELLERLNARVIAPEPPDPPTVLTTTNAWADAINKEELAALPGDSVTYTGRVDGNFKLADTKLPSPFHLSLKLDARVMFTKNDTDRRWVNGSLGLVKSLGKDKVSVKLLDGGFGTVDVERVSWETYKYEYDYEEERISSVVTGSYTQFPLMPAWAITIHKGQGKTLPSAMVDFCTGAFAPGQAYVALSRCRSLADLWLAQKVTPRDIFCDPRITDFYDAVFADRPETQEDEP